MKAIQKLKKLLKSFVSRHFLMYVLIGTFNTLNVAIITHLLAMILHDYPSSYLAYIISLVIGYILNAKMNFRQKLGISACLKFMSAYIPHFFIFAAISTVALSVWNFPPFWATVVASIAGSPVTYLIMRFFAFGNRKKNK
ncbi:MAG: GtrA family protein [Clostridia bacterium]|nr:GtrA family protein [Clostridia bacterium]